jgi:DNA-binding PadR family transcriptional regulator
MAIAPDEREALRMLADSPNGCTESIILAHGFAIGMLRDLVRNGLATSEPRTVRSGQRLIEVKWMTITDAGRRELGLRGLHFKLSSAPAIGARSRDAIRRARGVSE